MLLLKKLTRGSSVRDRQVPYRYNYKQVTQKSLNRSNKITKKENPTLSSEVSPIFVKKRHDNRPFVEIQIFGVKMIALLDSGANHSVIGKSGYGIIDKFKLKIDKFENKYVTTADGSKQVIVGQVDIPVCINSECRVVNFYVVPSLNHSVILGSSFCRQFSVNIDYKTETWDIQNCMCTIENFVPVENKTDLETHKNEIDKIKQSFQEIASTDSHLGRTHKLIHSIDTGDAKPFKQKQYLMSPYMLNHLNQELDKMLKLKVIEPSHGAWSSPVLLVKKANGEYRFCFDGRVLNSVTVPDRYPLPHIERILGMLRDAHFISSIDLRAAFWQIPLDEASKEKTGFTVPGRGMFRFTVTPFGLCNSAQTQQRLMDAVFGPELEPNIFCYLDDIIVVSKTFEEHVCLLETVKKRLKDANLRVNIEKCEFFKNSLRYLGYIVDGDGLRTDPDKVSAMVNYPRPKTATEMKRFVGMCSWYRRFVPHFSTLMSPINDLLKQKKKKQELEWNAAAEEAFIKIKQALVSAPVLRCADFEKPFTVQCDASDTGLGGVLTQEINGEEVVIAFCSRAMSKAERNYCITQRELLALLFCIEKFRPYIEGTHFKVITDHYSLLWLNKLKEPTGKLARWSLKLQQYTFELIHRKGKFNVVPDALSRANPEVDIINFTLDNLDNWYQNLRDKILQHSEKYPQWKVENDRVYKQISTNTPLASNESEWKELVPDCQRSKIMSIYHDQPTSAHLGFFKTLARVQQFYYWPKMRRDILKYVRSCVVCNAQKMPNKSQMGLMGSEKKVKYPWQIISVDIMGPLPRSSKGNSYLLVVADWFTKYTLLLPMRKAIASTIVKFMENEVFLVYGVPQFIICDNGSQLAGTQFKRFAKKYDVQKIWYNARYHPQCNPVERINRTVGTAIRSYVGENHRTWDQHLKEIQFALNTAKHEVTGYSPAFLNFGRLIPITGSYYGEIKSTDDCELLPDDRELLTANLKTLSDIREEIRHRLHNAYLRNVKSYNLRKRDVTFQEGEKVWRRNKILSDASRYFSAKLAPKYVLCTIRKRISRLIYALNNADGSDAGEWHIKDLKQYFGSNSDISVG